MTFTAYIQRQKSLIRSRRDEQFAYTSDAGEDITKYDTEKLFADLSSFKGLNTAERQQYSKVFSHA